MRLARSIPLLLSTTLLAIAARGGAADVPVRAPDAPAIVDTAVVCPRDFLSALAPWLDRRQAQGHRAVVIENLPSAAALRQRIASLATQHPLKFVVLIGDAPAVGEADPIVLARSIPTFLPAAKVNTQFGNDKDIAADSPYADIDGDGLPDLAIGRIAVDSPAELTTVVQKIAAYEENKDFGPWRRQLNFVAGMGGFGQLADSVLEATAKRFIAEGLAPAYALTMTYGSWRSPYCPDPRRFHDVTVERLNEGSLFWVYIGHGQRHALDRVKVPGADHHILGARDVSKLQSQHGLPIAFFLACYTAAYDDRRDCLAEDLLRTPGGPVAVVGGSRVTMPYGMTAMAAQLVEACFVEHQPTLGEILLAAKRNMMLKPRDDENSKSMDLLARTFNPPGGDLADERKEHVLMFNLIGDPLLRIRQPQPLTLDVPAEPPAGETLRVTGQSPLDGPCRVELVVRRDRLKFRPPARNAYDGSDEALSAYEAIYREANDPCLDSATCAVSQGKFEVDLKIPAETRGPCHVRAYVEGRDDFALGSADLTIGRATPAPNR